MADTIISLMGVLSMLVCFAGAWWLWFHDPPWPWTQAAVPRDAPERRAALPPVEAEASQTQLLSNPQAEVPPPTDATQILSDPSQFAFAQRDEDAPVAPLDQLETQPVREAQSFHAPPPHGPTHS